MGREPNLEQVVVRLGVRVDRRQAMHTATEGIGGRRCHDLEVGSAVFGQTSDKLFYQKELGIFKGFKK
jgi:hypothetical protein